MVDAMPDDAPHLIPLAPINLTPPEISIDGKPAQSTPVKVGDTLTATPGSWRMDVHKVMGWDPQP